MKKTVGPLVGICLAVLWAVNLNAQVINACAKKNNGQMRIVDGPEKCLSSEVFLSWPTFPVAPEQRVWVNDLIGNIPNEWIEVRSLTFNKVAEDTALMVEYDENILVGVPYTENGLSLRIVIDENECVAPGPIEKEFAYAQQGDIWYVFVTDSIFTRALCSETTAGPIPAGEHTVSVAVRKTFPCEYNVCRIDLSSTLESPSNANAVARLSVEEMTTAP